MLRRIIIAATILTLFLGVITSPGYGQAKSSILTKVQVEKLARERLNIREDYTLQYSDLYTRDIQQKQFWNLNFEGENKYISVTIAADTGEIISINRRDSDDHRGVVTLLRDEAEKIAIDFIESLEKEKFKETEEVTVKAPTFIPYYLYNDVQASDNYYFMFVRKLKEEFFPNNYFIVNVSGINGGVVSYEMQWDEASYEGNRQLLSEKKARELFEKDDRLNLKYVRLNKYNPEDSEKMILTPVYTYAPRESDKIDAVTGKLLSHDELYDKGHISGGYGAGSDDRAMMKEMSSLNGGVETIPEEGVISKEKAEHTVMEVLKDNVDLDDIKLSN
ncbi:MAG: hypothetical protein M0P14_01190, partial [Alkaliphilus sp.]|nr:hypothetical protein [Alkaliphilus sp.]